jgi:hypothetical protein
MSKSNQINSLRQSEQAKRVTLAEWRAGRLHDLKLPSGLDVKVRDVSLTDLALTGRIPNTLMDVIMQANGDEEKTQAVVTQNAADFGKMLDVLTQACLVEPAIGAVADAEHILLEEIPSEDKLFIFNHLNREAEQMRSFREGEAEPAQVA